MDGPRLVALVTIGFMVVFGLVAVLRPGWLW
jgi:hypothetical protein